jgi:hypothetical protein
MRTGVRRSPCNQGHLHPSAESARLCDEWRLKRLADEAGLVEKPWQGVPEHGVLPQLELFSLDPHSPNPVGRKRDDEAHVLVRGA